MSYAFASITYAVFMDPEEGEKPGHYALDPAKICVMITGTMGGWGTVTLGDCGEDICLSQGGRVSFSQTLDEGERD